MSNFPIAIMVKLTYTIIEVIDVAEFCLACLNKINKTNDSSKKYFISKDLDLCEECGEWKNVIIMERKGYYLFRFRFIMLPFKIVGKMFYILWRVFILPYSILRYKKWEIKTDKQYKSILCCRKNDSSIKDEKYSLVCRGIRCHRFFGEKGSKGNLRKKRGRGSAKHCFMKKEKGGE